jgi:hypothetical protein
MPLLQAEIAVLSSTEVRLTLQADTATRDPVSGACAVTWGEADGEADPEAAAAAIRAFRQAYSHLLTGEQLGASAGGAEIVGRVVAHRRHSAALLFLDLEAGNETLQAIVRAHSADASFALATRRGSTVRAVGAAGRSRRGELSLFASGLALLRLPAESDAVLACARLVAAGIMPVATAGRLIGCDTRAVGELAHAIEGTSEAVWAGGADGNGGSAGGSSAADSLRCAARALASSVLGRRNRRRPARFHKAEVGGLARLTAEHGLPWPVEMEDRLVALGEISRGGLHPEAGLPSVCEADSRLRSQYIHRKKVPQLRWMLAQLETLLSHRTAHGTTRAVVLDLGCGRADLTLLIAARHPSARVVGLDSNALSLRSAVERARAAGLRNVSFVLADAATGEAVAGGEAKGGEEERRWMAAGERRTEEEGGRLAEGEGRWRGAHSSGEGEGGEGASCAGCAGAMGAFEGPDEALAVPEGASHLSAPPSGGATRHFILPHATPEAATGASGFAAAEPRDCSNADLAAGGGACEQTGGACCGEGTAGSERESGMGGKEWESSSALDRLMPSTPDVVVALHACGGLTDVALGLAARWRSSAVVCSCCFNKHRRLSPADRWALSEGDKDLLCRMADCDIPALSASARHLASCLRLRRFMHELQSDTFRRGKGGTTGARGAAADVHACSGAGGDGAAGRSGAASVSIKCFDPSYSAQNTVLVARVEARHAVTISLRGEEPESDGIPAG